MTTVSFPLTLTGSYTDGSVCSAADYRADFEKLRDAINHMHERFSTLVFTGHDITYQKVAKNYIPAAGDEADGFPGSSATVYSTTKKILNVMAVPSWMQGIRVRGLELCNFSRLPAQGQTGADEHTYGGEPIYYYPRSATPLKYGIAHASALSALDPNNWTATDIATITLDTDAKVRGPYQLETTDSLNEDSVFADGTGYHTASANVVVPPGNFLVVYGTGGVDFQPESDGSGTTIRAYDLNWHFAVNALCDAMVPVL